MRPDRGACRRDHCGRSIARTDRTRRHLAGSTGPHEEGRMKQGAGWVVDPPAGGASSICSPRASSRAVDSWLNNCPVGRRLSDQQRFRGDGDRQRALRAGRVARRSTQPGPRRRCVTDSRAPSPCAWDTGQVAVGASSRRARDPRETGAHDSSRHGRGASDPLSGPGLPGPVASVDHHGHRLGEVLLA